MMEHVPMTLLPVRNQLLAHFSRKDTLSIEEFKDIAVSEECGQIKESVIRAVLEEMAENGFISPIDTTPEDEPYILWMLAAPMGSHGQTVDISLPVAAGIATILNGYAEANSLPIEPADALEIDESHIVGLMDVISELLGIIATQKGGT